MRIILLLLASLQLARSQPQSLSIDWQHSVEALAGQFTQVKLTDGTRIGGSWVAVTPITFTMKVEETSNRSRLTKGPQTIPRASILEITAGRRRARGRVIGTLAGYLGIAAIAALASGAEAAQGPWGIAILGGGVAGYFIGKSVDHATRTIIFLPDAPAASVAAEDAS